MVKLSCAELGNKRNIISGKKDREKLKEEGDETIIINCINTIGWHLATGNFLLPTLFPT
jgi:hypothetical protein